MDPLSHGPEPCMLPVHYTPRYLRILACFLIEYNYKVPIAQRIEHMRPKRGMEVQFFLGTQVISIIAKQQALLTTK